MVPEMVGSKRLLILREITRKHNVVLHVFVLILINACRQLNFLEQLLRNNAER